MSKLTKSSLAKSAKFNHKEHADRLEELNSQAQNARRVDVALGLFCYELKEIHLQYGQFGKWLAEHRPALARQDVDGNWKPANSLDTAMWMAKSALEVCGYKIGDYVELVQNQFPCVQGNCDASQLMLLPAAKLPEEFKKLRDGIFELVDGKSQRQLRAEFKQIDEETGGAKRGRLKNSGGLTKAQREAAAAREEAERLLELEEQLTASNEFELEIADAKGLGMMDSKLLKKFIEARETSVGFARRVLESRSSQTATDAHK